MNNIYYFNCKKLKQLNRLKSKSKHFNEKFFCEEQIRVNEKNHVMLKSKIKSKYQFFDEKK